MPFSPSSVWRLQQPDSKVGRAPGLLALIFCLTLTAATESLTLTDEHRVGSIPIDGSALASQPILEIDVTEVSNPATVPIGVAVTLTDGGAKIPVGRFAFFPSDHKGNFLLNSRAAFLQLGSSKNARLVFELKKLRDSAPWKPVRITIAPPKWRSK